MRVSRCVFVVVLPGHDLAACTVGFNAITCRLYNLWNHQSCASVGMVLLALNDVSSHLVWMYFYTIPGGVEGWRGGVVVHYVRMSSLPS